MDDKDKKIPIDLAQYDTRALSLRIWHGMAFDAWIKIMRGKWRLVSPSRYPLVAMITIFSIGNQFLKWASILIYGRRVAQVQISPDPIFVIGFWRSGTTWLHQMMMADPRHAAPQAHAVFSPETFLAGRAIVKWVMRRGLSETRPMDNVRLTTDTAEEDEHAIYLSGAIAPGISLLTPNDTTSYPVTPDEMTPKDAAFWRRKWIGFLKSVQYVSPGKRLVLKSPGHTRRIAEILRHFPDAKFIHIVRDPYKIMLSNQKMRIAMQSVCALQDHLPSADAQEASLVRRFIEFHQQFERERPAIPSDQITTVHYEDLRSDTLGVLRQVYEDLDLGDFSVAEPVLATLTSDAKPYQNNQYEMDAHTRDLVEREFGDYFQRYGYLPMADRPATAP